jgi:hypothetical protein
MSKEPELEITRRRLPHWRLAGATYFVTFRLAHGRLSPEEVLLVRDHIVGGDPDYYALTAVVVMPDHVHVLLRPRPSVELSRVLKGIKGSTARRLNKHRGSKGSVWQEESFDRIVRDRKELEEKLNYMFHNPVKAGLVEDPWKHEGWYVKREES